MMTQLDGYPLPSIRQFASQLKDFRYFSKVDLIKSFHQIPLDLESSKKTTIVTPWGAWQFLRLAMGLRNSAQSFQRMMTSVLDGLSNCYCYLDDILVFTKTEGEHFKILHELFTCLQRAGLAVSLDKCAFGQSSMDFLGYHVGPNGIKPLPKKVVS